MKTSLTAGRNNRSFQLEMDRIIFFLLFLFFSEFSAQIYIAEGTVIHNENNVISTINDSQYGGNIPKAKIYVASDAIIVGLENDNQYDISIIPRKDKILKKQHLAKKLPHKKVNKLHYPEIVLRSESFISDLSSSHTKFSKISNVFVGFVPRSTSYNKIFISISDNNTLISFNTEDYSSLYIYSETNFFDYSLNAFSVRPPPCL